MAKRYFYSVRLVSVNDTVDIGTDMFIAHACDAVRSNAKDNNVRLRSENIDLTAQQPYVITFNGLDEYDWPVLYIIMVTENSRNAMMTPDDQGEPQFNV